MKKIIIFFLTFILMGCGNDNFELVEDRKVINLTESEKQALALEKIVISKADNQILTVKDELIRRVLMVEIYEKAGIKDIDVDLILLKFLTDPDFEKTFKKEFKSQIKAVKSLKIPKIKTDVVDDFLVVSFENIKIKIKLDTNINDMYYLSNYVKYEHYINNERIFISKDAEALITLFLTSSGNDEYFKYISDKQKNIYLVGGDAYEIALKKVEEQDGNLEKTTIYDCFDQKYIEVENDKESGRLLKRKSYNPDTGEQISDYKIKLGKEWTEVFFEGIKLIEYSDKFVKSFDNNGIEKGFIDLERGILEEKNGKYKIEGKANVPLKLSSSVYSSDLKDIFLQSAFGEKTTEKTIKVIKEYENEIFVKEGSWISESNALSKKIGIHKEWYPNKNLKSVANYGVEKQWVGEEIKIKNYEEYYENGQLKSVANYEGGKIKNYEEYYENGQLKELTEHSYGSLTKEYDKNGQLTKEYSFFPYKDKKLYNGTYKEYYENGNIKQIGDYVSPYTYEELSKLSEIEEFDLLNEFKKYYVNKNRKQKIVESIKEQNWYYYDNEGNLIKEMNIDRVGILEPIKKINVKEYGYYRDNNYNCYSNLKQYVLKYYYLDEKDALNGYYEEQGYQEGVGPYTKLRGEFKDNLKIGTWYEYDCYGNVIKTTEYVDGKSINEISDELFKEKTTNNKD